MSYFNHPSIPEWENTLLLCFLGNSAGVAPDAGETVESEEKMWQQEMGRLRTCYRAQRPGVLGDVQP